MIQNFKDSNTEKVFNGELPKGFPQDVFHRGIVKLDQLQSAIILEDLRIPPSNQLDALRGNLKGFFSILINKQWRLCFRWENGNAFDVQITDYH